MIKGLAAARSVGLLLALLQFAFHPARAVAAESSLSERLRTDVTSTTLAGWHAGNVRYGEIFERLNLGAGSGAWQFGARLDGATFSGNVGPSIKSSANLEKIWLGWTGRSLELVGGDSYLSFGRGLTLSLRKVDELGVDTTLRGAKALVHLGALNAVVSAGITNINNLDEASGKSEADPNDLVFGAQIQGTAVNALTLGAHASAVAFRAPLALIGSGQYDDRYFQFGPTIDANLLNDRLSVYLEGIAQFREVAGDGGSGFGVYGSSTAAFDELTLTFEGKAYGTLKPVRPNIGQPEFASVAYNNPPTVERLLQPLENPQQEVAGGRLRLDWNLSPGVTGFVNYGFFADWLGYADPLSVGELRPGLIHDPYLGLEARTEDGQSKAQLSGGIRTVHLGRDTRIVRRDGHLSVDALQALGSRWHLTFHLLHLERMKYESPILHKNFREGGALLGLRLNPVGMVAGGYDYTTDPTQSKRHYVNAHIEWNMTPSSNLRLLVGGTRGGLKCLSGVCRVFPPFRGAKLVATLRF